MSHVVDFVPIVDLLKRWMARRWQSIAIALVRCRFSSSPRPSVLPALWLAIFADTGATS
jgi:hypothetical protein